MKINIKQKILTSKVFLISFFLLNKLVHNKPLLLTVSFLAASRFL